MEVYTLGDIRIIARLKERSMSCKQMEITHCSKSNMNMKRERSERVNNLGP
jgi:hypothetical protein